jgi:hypothetical protein
LAEADDSANDDDILQHFQTKYKEALMTKLQVSKDDCNVALKRARNEWIDLHDGQDWLDAHDFFHGACQAVRNLLAAQGSNANNNVYIITTKAKEYALRLLRQQDLYDDGNGKHHTLTTIPESHIFGLGSGPKSDVLGRIMNERKADMAVMVEDNLMTLQKILKNHHDKVLPVLASWGYNTKPQQQQAETDHYVVLSPTDSASLAQVLTDESVRDAFRSFQKAIGNQKEEK